MAGAFIETAKKALKVFTQSLPLNCTFSIVSFGNVCQLHKALKPDVIEGQNLKLTPADPKHKIKAVFEYDQKNLDDANAMIDSMTANYGGTALVRPLNSAIDAIKNSKKKQGRIFILTDGVVSDKKGVFEILEKNLPEYIKISTFGIGSEFDVEVVKELALKGKGHCTEIRDLKKASLSQAVVKALGFAMNPSMSDTAIMWDDGDGNMRF